MKSDLYGAYSVSVAAGGSESYLWHRLGSKHPVSSYRLLIPDHDQLGGEEKMFAEDKVDSFVKTSEG